MADTQVSALSAASALTGTELFYADDGSADVKVTTQQIITAATGASTITGATITTSSKPLLNLTQTWNDGAVEFTALKLDVTTTANATASKLIDLQADSTSYFTVELDAIDRPIIVFGSTSGVALRASGDTLSVLTGSQGGYGRVYVDRVGFGGAAFLISDAGDVVAQRNSTTSQTFNFYDTYTSDTDYHRLAIKTARATLSGVSGATVTATNLIPDGAVVVGVTSKVTTGLGTGNGTTGYTIGDGSDADRWGAITGTASGTSSDNRDWTATTVQAFTAANNVVVTATGGNFDGTGVIYLSVQYLIGQCD